MSKGSDNLIVPTSEQARINGRKGGLASAESKKRKKLLKECLEILLEKEIEGKHGEVMSGAEAISVKLFQKALQGDIKAFEVVRDTAGQKPVEKVESTNTVVDLNSFTTEEIIKMLDEEI